MLSAHKRQRFQELRSRTAPRTPEEQAEFDTLLKEIEAAEAGYLEPARQRLRLKREQVEGRNRSLEALAIRRQALAQRLEAALLDAVAERRAIEDRLLRS